MSNILIVPDSGSIYFTTGSASSSAIPNLSSGVAFKFDNSAGVNITSYATGVSDNDRFSIDGYNGRLFNVSDNLTGIIFSVNDGAGLPIIEVDSGAVDKVTMGTYGTNTFVINDNKIGIGSGVPAAKLDIFDNVLAGSAGLSGSILNLNQTWNTSGTPTAIKLNVIDTASNADSNLIDLQVGGVRKFKVNKLGYATANRFMPNTHVGLSWFGSDDHYNLRLYVANEPRMQLTAYGALQLAGTAPLAWTSSYFNAGLTPDTFLLRDEAANTLAMRNGVNPQAFRLYNTYTDATTFERLNIKWDTNVLKIGTEKGSAGGVARAMELQTDGATRMTVTSAGNVGIGATNPVKTLQLGDGTTVSPNLFFYANEGSGNPEIRFATRNNYDTFSVSIFTTGDPSFLSIGGRHASTTLSSTLNIYKSETRVEIPNNLAGSTFNILGSTVENSATIFLGSPANDTAKNSRIIFGANNRVEGKGGIFFTPDGTGYNRGNLDIVVDTNTNSLTVTNPTASGVTGIRLTSIGRVGIGTTSPTQKLEVSGGSVAIDSGSISTSATIYGKNGGYGSLRLTGKDNYQPFIDLTGHDAQYNFPGTVGGGIRIRCGSNYGGYNGVIAFENWNGGSNVVAERMRIDGSTGNVGIGITAPAAKLDIADTTLAGSGSLAGSILNLAQTWNTTGAPTAIKLNVTNTASGATSNLLDLQVGGVSHFNISKIGMVDLAQSQASGGLNFAGGYYGVMTAFNWQLRNSNGYIGLGATSTEADTRLYRDDSNTLALRNGVNPQTFRLYNTYTDATTFERLNIKWDANVLKIGTEKGSVGGTARNLEMDFPISFLSKPTSVGETRNVYLSHFNGASYIGSFFQVNNFTNVIRLNANTTDGQNILFYFGNNDLGSKIGNNGVDQKQLIFNNLNTTSGSMRWIMGSTEAIRLTQEGNLGIGTATPTEKLVVNGSFSVYPNSFNSESRLITRSIHSDGRWALDIRANTASGDVQALAVYQSVLGIGSGEFLTGAISSAIGISSNITYIPKLRIAGNGTGPNNASGLVIGSSSYTEWSTGANYPDGSNYYEIRTNLSAPAQLGGMVAVPTRAPLNIDAKYLSFLTGNTTGVEAMRIASVGNVGIGTTTPTEKLHVLGNIRNVGNLSISNSDIATTLDRLTVDGSQGRLFTVTDSLVGSLMSVNDIAGLPILEVFDDDKIVMGEYASNALTVLGKNVGIGTGSPTAKLDILDTVLAGSGSLAGSVLNLAQTWNTTGNPTAIKLNVTNTASGATSNLLDLQVGGSSKFKINKNGVVSIADSLTGGGGGGQGGIFNEGGLYVLWSAGSAGVAAGGFLGFNNSNNYTISPTWDLRIYRDASNTLAQRNGANPQAFRLYNTYTSSTNFERLNLRWDTNVVKIGTEKGSAGGVARDLSFETDATTRMTIAASGDISFSNPTQVRTALGFVQLTPAEYAALVEAGTTNPDTIYIVQE